MKRQRKAGKVLAGRAAKLKRRADLKARGVDDEWILDDLVAAVGLPGQIFYVNGSNSDKLPKLPGNMQVRVSLGERATDKGLEGVKRFFATHKCGALCANMKLPTRTPDNLIEVTRK